MISWTVPLLLLLFSLLMIQRVLGKSHSTLITFYSKMIWIIYSPGASCTQGLFFNSSKCKSLFISSRTQSVSSAQSYSIHSSAIDSVDLYKDLGIIFTANLNWNFHHARVLHQAYKSLCFLHHTLSIHHSPVTKLNLYTSLVNSKLSFCYQMWHPHLLKDIRALEQFQHHATKFILHNHASYYKIKFQSLN